MLNGCALLNCIKDLHHKTLNDTHCILQDKDYGKHLPDIANPLKPTANTRNEMATTLLWE